MHDSGTTPAEEISCCFTQTKNGLGVVSGDVLKKVDDNFSIDLC